MGAVWVIPFAMWSAAPLEKTAAAAVAEYRSDVRQAMVQSAKAKKPDPEVVAPELLAIYKRLDTAKNLPKAEQRRMLRLVGTRLHELETTLARRVSGPAGVKGGVRVLKQQLPAQNTPSAAGNNSGGNTPQARAQALIELIQATVDPETWDVNGGEGSAFYFHPTLGLVIRQTAEVHDQIGGTLRGQR